MNEERESDIQTYFHCNRCIVEKPTGISPKEWARTQAGFTADGAI